MTAKTAQNHRGSFLLVFFEKMLTFPISKQPNKPDNIYDTAIVGGGPAGTTLARLLAEKHISVAIFDRKKKRSRRRRISETVRRSACRRRSVRARAARPFAPEIRARRPATFQRAHNRFFHAAGANLPSILHQHESASLRSLAQIARSRGHRRI